MTGGDTIAGPMDLSLTSNAATRWRAVCSFAVSAVWVSLDIVGPLEP